MIDPWLLMSDYHSLFVVIVVLMVASLLIVWWGLSRRQQNRPGSTNGLKGCQQEQSTSIMNRNNRPKGIESTNTISTNHHEETVRESIRVKTRHYVPVHDLRDQYIVEDSDDDEEVATDIAIKDS